MRKDWKSWGVVFFGREEAEQRHNYEGLERVNRNGYFFQQSVQMPEGRDLN